MNFKKFKKKKKIKIKIFHFFINFIDFSFRFFFSFQTLMLFQNQISYIFPWKKIFIKEKLFFLNSFQDKETKIHFFIVKFHFFLKKPSFLYQKRERLKKNFPTLSLLHLQWWQNQRQKPFCLSRALFLPKKILSQIISQILLNFKSRKSRSR